MNLSKIIPKINDYVTPLEDAIFPNEMSMATLSVPGLISQYSNDKAPILKKIPVLPYMLGCLYEIRKSYRIINKNPSNVKTEYNEDILKELKVFAKKNGMSEIGYTKVTPEVVFKDKFVQYQSAIVLTMEMSPEIIKTAPSKKSMKEVFRTYYQLCRFANKASKFLQKHGYGVQPGPALGGDTNYVLLARNAGLGEVGKHGLLITETEGSSLRIGSVFTSMELRYNTQNKYAWIRNFCNSCNQCVRACPAGAIYEQTKIDELGRKKHIDITRCAVPFANEYGCTVCVKSCTFFRNDFDKIKKGFMKRTS